MAQTLLSMACVSRIVSAKRTADSRWFPTSLLVSVSSLTGSQPVPTPVSVQPAIVPEAHFVICQVNWRNRIGLVLQLRHPPPVVQWRTSMIGASGSRHLSRRRGSSPCVNPLLARSSVDGRRLSTQREEHESELDSDGLPRRKASDASSRRESRVIHPHFDSIFHSRHFTS